MKKINTIFDLKQEITLLEVKQASDAIALKDQFRLTYESLRPVNLIRNTLKDITSSPDLKGDLLSSTLGIGAGYLTKKAVAGSTHNPIKQIVGTLLQLGVTNLIATKGDLIKSGAFKLLNLWLSKKKSTAVEVEEEEIVTHV